MYWDWGRNSLELASLIDNHSFIFDFYCKEQGKLGFPRQQDFSPSPGPTTRNLPHITVDQSEPSWIQFLPLPQYAAGESRTFTAIVSIAKKILPQLFRRSPSFRSLIKCYSISLNALCKIVHSYSQSFTSSLSCFVFLASLHLHVKLCIHELTS